MIAQLPCIIRCTLKADDVPVSGILLKATLETAYKNNYSFIFGPTSIAGVAELSGHRILSEAAEEYRIAMMDYEPLERVFTGTIHLHCMSCDDIRRAMKAYALYKDASYFPEGYEEMLNSAVPVSKTHNYLVLQNIDINPHPNRIILD